MRFFVTVTILYLTAKGDLDDFTYTPVNNIDLFKVNNRNTKKRCEICSKLTLKTPERR